MECQKLKLSLLQKIKELNDLFSMSCKKNAQLYVDILELEILNIKSKLPLVEKFSSFKKEDITQDFTIQVDDIDKKLESYVISTKHLSKKFQEVVINYRKLQSDISILS